MKKIILSITLILAGILVFAQTAETKFLGKWYTEEKDKTTVDVYKATDGLYYGKIVASAKPEFIGKMMMLKLKFNAKDNTLEGNMKQPSDGMEAKSTLSIVDDKTLKVVAKKFFMTKTIMMVRPK